MDHDANRTNDADPQGSQPSKTDAQPPGDSQVTNPNRMIGDGDEVTSD
jgi:hypothetical protein